MDDHSLNHLCQYLILRNSLPNSYTLHISLNLQYKLEAEKLEELILATLFVNRDKFDQIINREEAWNVHTLCDDIQKILNPILEIENVKYDLIRIASAIAFSICLAGHFLNKKSVSDDYIVQFASHVGECIEKSTKLWLSTGHIWDELKYKESILASLENEKPDSYFKIKTNPNVLLTGLLVGLALFCPFFLWK